jgi:hypothetical protein
MKPQRGRAYLGHTPMLLLATGLAMVACEDSGGPPEGTGGSSTDGTLIVSTSTKGGDPDRDGFQLTIDGGSSTPLAPTDTAEVSGYSIPHWAAGCSKLPTCLSAGATFMQFAAE